MKSIMLLFNLNMRTGCSDFVISKLAVYLFIMKPSGSLCKLSQKTCYLPFQNSLYISGTYQALLKGGFG